MAFNENKHRLRKLNANKIKHLELWHLKGPTYFKSLASGARLA